MLLDRETENRITQIINAVVSSFSAFAIGRELGQSFIQAVSSGLGLTTAGRLSFLESAFIAGKAAQLLGTDRLRRMTESELVAWLRVNNVQLTASERTMLNQMKDNTERWLLGRSTAWQQRMRAEIAVVDTQWRSTLANTNFRDAQALTIARSAALGNLLNRIEDSAADWIPDVDRLVQSEMNNYFQTAQVTGLSGEEIVYKQPRASACRHCLRICVTSGGDLRRFRLSDVSGNSNVGTRAESWVFTIGPIHPYCYCVLYRETDINKGPQQALKEARAEFHKSLKKSANECGISDDPDLLFEEQGQSNKHGRPPHVTAMINAVKRTYGDRLPGLSDD